MKIKTTLSKFVGFTEVVLKGKFPAFNNVSIKKEKILKSII